MTTQFVKGLFIIYWEYGTGVSGYRTRTFLMLPSMGHKDFLCFYDTGHELFLEKNLSNCIVIISRGGNSHRLGY